MRSIEILGVCVHDATYDDLLAAVDRFVDTGQPHQIITVNPEMLVIAHDDPGFRRILGQSDLNVADGAGLMLAARILGRELRQRVTGSDGVFYLSRHAAERGYRVFFLGAGPGVAETTARRLAAAYPGLIVAGTYGGSPSIEESAALIDRVRAGYPDLLLVAYGVPAEEKWIAQHKRALGVPVMMGVGGSFDFVAGVARRAPPWMRRVGLEWLHRLLREPWRWRRQLALPRFLGLVIAQRLRQR